MVFDGRKRVVIEHVRPEIDCGTFPIKRVIGEKVVVQADIFADGHDEVAASLLYRSAKEEKWREVPMRFLVKNRWEGSLIVEEMGVYYYTVQGWIDHFRTWQKDLEKKVNSGQNIKVDLFIGSEYINKAAERASGKDAERLREIAEILREGNDVTKAISLALSED
ncbi:MAG: maltotransferase domain-containing protein, partial [Candidatus Lokiarchaeia archaeon]